MTPRNELREAITEKLAQEDLQRQSRTGVPDESTDLVGRIARRVIGDMVHEQIVKAIAPFDELDESDRTLGGKVLSAVDLVGLIPSLGGFRGDIMDIQDPTAYFVDEKGWLVVGSGFRFPNDKQVIYEPSLTQARKEILRTTLIKEDGSTVSVNDEPRNIVSMAPDLVRRYGRYMTHECFVQVCRDLKSGDYEYMNPDHPEVAAQRRLVTLEEYARANRKGRFDTRDDRSGAGSHVWLNNGDVAFPWRRAVGAETEILHSGEGIERRHHSDPLPYAGLRVALRTRLGYQLDLDFGHSA